jgi:hypothetical protein
LRSLLQLSACACALALASSPASAQQGAPVRIYPLHSIDAPSEVVSGVERALRRALEAREMTARFTSASDVTLDPLCGPVKGARLHCLSGMALDGFVLRGSVRPSKPGWTVTFTVLDSGGRLFGPATARLDAQLSPGPLVEALSLVSDRVIRGEAQPLPPAPGEAPVVVARPPAPSLALAAPPPAGRLTRAAQWTLLGGGVALALGAVSGLVARSMNQSLTSKFDDHTLSTADASTYGKVSNLSSAANLLFIASAVAGTTALFLWAADDDAPDPWRAR